MKPATAYLDDAERHLEEAAQRGEGTRFERARLRALIAALRALHRAFPDLLGD